MIYKTVTVTGRGSVENLKIVEHELREPLPGAARIKILATSVCQDDIAARVGNRPFLPKIPFIPGYAIVGIVEAVGPDVTEVAIGDRVAALTNFGGYAEVIYWESAKLVHVPTILDPAEAVILILNYVVAYQTLHRYAEVKAGDKVLIIGASGGVGTAYLQLGKLAGLTMYGLASSGKHPTLTEYGAIPIDYRSQDFGAVLRQTEPDGLDFVFNGMAENYLTSGLAVLRRGGVYVHYGAPESMRGMIRFIGGFIGYNLLPNGKTIKGYGTHRVPIEQLKEDWTALFQLLEQGQIKPIIAQRFPILEAAQANTLLESGSVVGNLVLLAPELL
ncbi:medium chain dehydrogenase/reductase family protein [Chloroflexota bacterium]